MNPHPYLFLCFYGRTKLIQKSMLVSTYWPYYSEMEYMENYRRVMVACVKNIIYPLDFEALGFSLPNL